MVALWWIDKIIYIYLDREPTNLVVIDDKNNEDKKNKNLLHNTYLRENSQRNMINEGITSANSEDIINKYGFTFNNI